MPNRDELVNGKVAIPQGRAGTPAKKLAMSQAEKSLARLEKAAQRVRDAESRAADARRELRILMLEEIDAGHLSQAAIARAFGVTRQRIRQMLDQLD